MVGPPTRRSDGDRCAGWPPFVVLRIAGSAGSRDAEDGFTDPERLRVKQHEGDAGDFRATVDPRVICTTLHHHVAGAEGNTRVVHQHLELALQHDHVVDGFRPMHRATLPGPEIDYRE